MGRLDGAAAGGPCYADLSAFLDALALVHVEGVEVQVGGVEASVGGPNRHREPRVTGRPGEGHGAVGCSPHRLANRGRDVDAAVLSRREGIAAVAVIGEDLALHRPGPRFGPERGDGSRQRRRRHRTQHDSKRECPTAKSPRAMVACRRRCRHRERGYERFPLACRSAWGLLRVFHAVLTVRYAGVACRACPGTGPSGKGLSPAVDEVVAVMGASTRQSFGSASRRTPQLTAPRSTPGTTRSRCRR